MGQELAGLGAEVNEDTRKTSGNSPTNTPFKRCGLCEGVARSAIVPPTVYASRCLPRLKVVELKIVSPCGNA